MNRPNGSLPWEMKPSELNSGTWTAVGYVLRGPRHGIFVPCHHWGDRRDAEAHVMFLNRGLTRERAHALTMQLVHLADPEGDIA